MRAPIAALIFRIMYLPGFSGPANAVIVSPSAVPFKRIVERGIVFCDPGDPGDLLVSLILRASMVYPYLKRASFSGASRKTNSNGKRSELCLMAWSKARTPVP